MFKWNSNQSFVSFCHILKSRILKYNIGKKFKQNKVVAVVVVDLVQVSKFVHTYCYYIDRILEGIICEM